MGGEGCLEGMLEREVLGDIEGIGETDPDGNGQI